MSEAVKELIDIVIKLRSDNGCDWDRKQTSESLTPHLIEEANEVVDAVLEKNSENLKEELGDLLLHVVFQAVIASEKKTFEFEDVVQQINEKLIKRHPHIFDKNYDGEDLSNAKNWELIKKSEKNRESILDGMPKSLSALIVAQRYQDKTGAVGFEWENFSQAMDKVDEELEELKQAINNNDLNNIEEEIGDLLITIVNLARFFDISADLALKKTNQKFYNRFNFIEKIVKNTVKNYSGLKVKSLNEKDLARLKMGSYLSVSKGSDEPPRMIIIEYNGGKKNEKPVALVGKGITFDTGGISLKPSSGMDEMKWDMCGAGTVFGVMCSLARIKADVNVVGIMACAENMPSARATKPGDVVTSMSGQTIEILNTDAEGRLVLADALTYVGRYKPSYVIDMATLTGAVVIALGSHASGVMANNQFLADKIIESGEETGDRAWQLPLWNEYKSCTKTNFADLANIGGGREAGTIHAAAFLSKFAEDFKWAHMDIAASAWSSSPKGGTGRPVPLICDLILNKKLK